MSHPRTHPNRPNPAVFLLIACLGCQGASRVEVVDLNRVLDILQAVLEKSGESTTAETKTALAEATDGNTEKARVSVGASQTENPAKTKAFLKEFADELNTAKLVSYPLGLELHSTGAIRGFRDSNRNMIKENGDSLLFTIEIDEQRNRLIASDTHGYRRDYHYRPGGFFTGYLIGSMMNRQTSYYTNRTKPNYGAMSMSSRDYHSGAVSSVRAKTGTSSSARSKTGTGSFFGFGK